MKALRIALITLALIGAYASLPAQTVTAQSATDLPTMWNTLVKYAGDTGKTVTSTQLTDAATVTWNTTDLNLNAATLPLFSPAVPTDFSTPCPTNQLSGAAYGLYTCIPIPDGLTARTVNVTGLTTSARYLLIIQPFGATAGAQTVNFGTGCTWQFSQPTGSDVLLNTSGSLFIPGWATWSYIVLFTYDGTNCNAEVLD